MTCGFTCENGLCLIWGCVCAVLEKCLFNTSSLLTDRVNTKHRVKVHKKKNSKDLSSEMQQKNSVNQQVCVWCLGLRQNLQPTFSNIWSAKFIELEIHTNVWKLLITDFSKGVKPRSVCTFCSFHSSSACFLYYKEYVTYKQSYCSNKLLVRWHKYTD